MMPFSPTHPLSKRFAPSSFSRDVKLLMELCKQMIAETVSAIRNKNAPGEKPQDTRAFGKPSEKKFPSGVASKNQRAEDG